MKHTTYYERKYCFFLLFNLAFFIILLSFSSAFANTGMAEFGKINKFFLDNIQGLFGKMIMLTAFGIAMANLLTNPSVKVMLPSILVGAFTLFVKIIQKPFGAMI